MNALSHLVRRGLTAGAEHPISGADQGNSGRKPDAAGSACDQPRPFRPLPAIVPVPSRIPLSAPLYDYVRNHSSFMITLVIIVKGLLDVGPGSDEGGHAGVMCRPSPAEGIGS
jgi:hypothetical protein